MSNTKIHLDPTDHGRAVILGLALGILLIFSGFVVVFGSDLFLDGSAFVKAALITEFFGIGPAAFACAMWIWARRSVAAARVARVLAWIIGVGQVVTVAIGVFLLVSRPHMGMFVQVVIRLGIIWGMVTWQEALGGVIAAGMQTVPAGKCDKAANESRIVG